MPPEALESLGPFMQRANGSSIGAIEHAPAPAVRPDKSHVAKNSKMFGNRWLRQAHGDYDFSDGMLAEQEKGEDLAAARFGHGVKSVGVGCGARHGCFPAFSRQFLAPQLRRLFLTTRIIVFLYGNMSRGILRMNSARGRAGIRPTQSQSLVDPAICLCQLDACGVAYPRGASKWGSGRIEVEDWIAGDGRFL